MEKALKERIIGAVVLVAVVVLVVPVFLDGPPETGEVLSERVPLPGQSEQTVQTVVLDRDRDAPVPARAEARPSEPAPETTARSAPPPPAAEPEPEPASREPAAEGSASEPPARAAAPESPVVSATGMWAVQLGSFSSQENAERLAADLRKQGFAAFLSQLDTTDGQLHRVRVGPQKDRETAESMAARLKKAGHNGQVVPHP